MAVALPGKSRKSAQRSIRLTSRIGMYSRAIT
jgi:hypothetical protein